MPDERDELYDPPFDETDRELRSNGLYEASDIRGGFQHAGLRLREAAQVAKTIPGWTTEHVTALMYAASLTEQIGDVVARRALDQHNGANVHQLRLPTTEGGQADA
jgi:hypothetical protein